MLSLEVIWWQLALFALCLATIFISVIKEADTCAAFSLGFTLGVCQWILKIDIWSWFLDYMNAMKFIFAYSAVGLLWSFFKWYFLVREIVTTRLAVIAKYNDTYSDFVAPSPARYRGEIIRFILTWPVGLICYIAEDMVTWLWSKASHSVGRVYEKIAHKVFVTLVNAGKKR